MDQAFQYKFDFDWLSQHLESWRFYLREFVNQPFLHFLEIGSYEGRSSVWLLENILADKSSRLTCIDPYKHQPIYERFNLNVDCALIHFCHNISRFGEKVCLIQEESGTALRNQNRFKNESFDFIYIDGSHNARDVLEDAVLAWPLLKQNGILIFDDYEWNGSQDDLLNPKIAIDAFLRIYAHEFNVLFKGYQVGLRKS